eukprot:3395029-Rhodomonas_salina.3
MILESPRYELHYRPMRCLVLTEANGPSIPGSNIAEPSKAESEPEPVLEQIARAGGTLSVTKAAGSEKGVFALLGNGKNPGELRYRPTRLIRHVRS